MVLLAATCGVVRAEPPAPATNDDARIDVVMILPGPLVGNFAVAEHFRKTLESIVRGPLEFHTEFVEEFRFPGAEYGRLLHGFLRQKYAARPVRLVFALGPASLDFLLRYRADLFSGVPIVFAGPRPSDVKPPGLPAGVTGIWRPLLAAETIEAALDLQPDAERVLVIGGTSLTERAIMSDAKTSLGPLERRVQIRYLTDRPMRDILAEVAALPPRSVVFYVVLQRDSEGRTFVPREALSAIAQVSRAPVYGPFDAYVGRGIVGGRVVSLTDLGVLGARLGAEILTAGPGAPPPPPREAPGIYQFDARELRRWGLDERRLPAGSIVLHREKSFWKRYGGLIGVTLLSLAEAVLITVLFLQWRRRRRAERSLAERLRFEELLSQLYARFVRARGAEVDAEIDRGLQRVGEFLGVDRATMVEVDDQARGVLHGHRWARPGADRAPLVALDRVPWLAERFRRGEIVRFSRPDELPPEAAVDRLTYESIGTRSHVAVPLMAGDAVLGGLFFCTLATERAWPDELVQRLPLLGEVFANVLARRRADEALRESRALSAAIVESLPGRVVVIDRAGIVIAVNEAVVLAAAGRRAESSWLTIGGDYLAVWRHACAAGDLGAGDVLRGIEAVLAGTSSHFSLEYLVGNDEHPHWVEFRVDPLRTPAGGAVVARLDISERKRAEADARQMREELARVGRAATMGQLTAALAHEVNQPLTGILSNAQAARRYLAKDEPDLKEIREILDDIITDDRRAGEIVNRLRAMLKRREPELVVIDVNQMVRDVVRFLHGDAVLRNASLVQDLAPAMPVINGDLVQLQQVLINLVLNGLDAMTQFPPERRRLIVKTERRDDAVCVAVRDFGTGLPAGGRERLFEPFFTTKADGMGMGLPIARSIVQAHGGDLWAIDNHDQGATFLFALPVANSIGDPPEPEARDSELMM